MSDSAQHWTRRQVLAAGGAALSSTLLAAEPTSGSSLIESIDRQTLWDNRDGKSITWFHPRACMVPQSDGSSFALMALQQISGSDYFGPVHWTSSTDLGKNWTDPQPIPPLGRRPVPDHKGLQQGVCDVVPEYHAKTNTTLAVGHAVFYRGNHFSRGDQLSRYPVYSVRKADGSWTGPHILEWEDPRGSFIYTNNCGQRVVLPNGDVLLSFTFGAQEAARSVAGVRCTFDGEKLQVAEVGPAITHKAGRGLLEPSLTQFQSRYYLTIRAEDNRGYVSVSDDGLNWQAKQPWCWDDGKPLDLSTTQQHWLTHSDGLFLVYTRKDATNLKVIRWRAPLFVAQVDPEKLVLLRETEQVVHPLIGDGVKAPNEVPLMGNFHVTNVSPTESWVTVGSWLPRHNAQGATHLARIHWAKPNRLV